ncbi:hypothetical protein SISNIDRAFT_491211 [Sistotremastrum niveocremeum HHB9708]|uniref:Uncharacterized protein n=1 Tax=Sistotremastrum niveocremeum HHB9708 TaxID=1314777 RepID=A0A164N0Y9_9AGAM|nr:hypothetical protein SISNIDRAFT_491211 [Sistotremastrum niveocremeum HHB9708]
MNSARSTFLGWGALIVAAGGGYYIAKRQLAVERKQAYEKAGVKPQVPMTWEQLKRETEGNSPPSNTPKPPT